VRPSYDSQRAPRTRAGAQSKRALSDLTAVVDGDVDANASANAW
jgi:hypothetical protein